MQASSFLNSSTAMTNLHRLQNKTSLLIISLMDVGIFPQYSDSSWQLGQRANKCFIPNSSVIFIIGVCQHSILEQSRNHTSAKKHEIIIGRNTT